MSYWKAKVLPKIKKLFDKTKKKGAAEACKVFDSSKVSVEKELEENSGELQPKVVEIYQSSTAETQKLLKEPNESAVKKNPDIVQKLLQELAKAGFPGAQQLCDAGTKFGPALLPGPIVFLLEKTSAFLPQEEIEAKESRDVAVQLETPPATESAETLAAESDVGKLASASPPEGAGEEAKAA